MRSKPSKRMGVASDKTGHESSLIGFSSAIPFCGVYHVVKNCVKVKKNATGLKI
jgi:hypothetical protein